MTDEELAKKRFFTLGFIRLFGVACAFLGVAIIARRWIEPADIIGGFLIVNGMIDVMILPPILARRWATPKK